MSFDSSDSFENVENPITSSIAPSNRAELETKQLNITDIESDDKPKRIRELGPSDILTTASTDDFVIETDALFIIDNDNDYIECLKQLFEVFVTRLIELKGLPSVIEEASGSAAIDFIRGYLGSIIDVSVYTYKLLVPSIQNELKFGFDLLISKFDEYASEIEAIKNKIDIEIGLLTNLEKGFGELATFANHCLAIRDYAEDDFTASFTYVESTHKWIYQLSAMKRDEMAINMMKQLIEIFEELKAKPLPDIKTIKTKAEVDEYSKQLKKNSAIEFLEPIIAEMEFGIRAHLQAPQPEGAVTISRRGNDYQIVEWNGLNAGSKNMRAGR